MRAVLGRWPRVCGLVIALLLHGLVVLPGLLSGRAPRLRPARLNEPLVVTVVGIVSGHQVEGARAERPPTAAQPPAAKRLASRKPLVPEKLNRSALSVPAALPVEAPRVVPAEPAPAAPPLESQSGEADRVARTVAPRVVDKAVLRQYVAGLSKAIQNKLIYPAEARDSATIGSPMIAFTLAESGEILPGTLRIQRSSGFAVLDEAALRAALASAPFPRPPERMEISITVSFALRE